MLVSTSTHINKHHITSPLELEQEMFFLTQVQNDNEYSFKDIFVFLPVAGSVSLYYPHSMPKQPEANPLRRKWKSPDPSTYKYSHLP